MKVKEIMTKKVVTIPLKSTLFKAAKILLENNVSGAPVVDEEGNLAGIVSEKDIFKSLYPSHAEFYESPGVWIDLDNLEERTKEAVDKLVQDFMTREVVCVNPDASLMQVGSMMLVRGIHRVVVTGHKNSIEGIVTRRDIYLNILKKRLNIQ
jgi:CBS domain-containing protein